MKMVVDIIKDSESQILKDKIRTEYLKRVRKLAKSKFLEEMCLWGSISRH